MIQYFVNEKKRTVVAKIIDENSRVESLGRAVCSPNDEWDVEKGKTIARKRAIMADTLVHINKARAYRKQINARIDAFIAKQQKHYAIVKEEVKNL
jgi:hypothetical protein